MSYSTVADFGLYAIPKSLRPLATTHSSLVQHYLDVASLHIDAEIISVHGDIPLASPGELIKYCERVIASWRLIVAEGINVGAALERVEALYYEVIGSGDNKGLLEKIKEGLINLPTTVDATPKRASVTSVDLSQGVAAFTSNGKLYIY